MSLAEQLQIDPLELSATKYVATVFNCLPIEIVESKPGLFPSRFVLPAATIDAKGVTQPGILHVGEGFHFIDNVLIEQGKPGATIRQTTNPNVLANSIVNDYKYAHIALSEGAEPGLFWLPTKLTLVDLHADVRYTSLYNQIMERQKNWYRNLIALADADWEKNHNMLSVSDLQRMAARHLKVQKAWVDFVAVELLNCPMCSTNVAATSIICQACKFILKPAEFEKNKKNFASGGILGGVV